MSLSTLSSAAAAIAPAMTKARGAGYSRIEDLLICKAFIAASEDPQKGANKKTKLFQTEMHNNYVKLLCEQERVDYEFLRTSTNNIITPAAAVYGCHTALAILDCFHKVIRFHIMKFVAIEKASGNCVNMYFDVCNDIFQKRHLMLGNFNDFCLCKDYLLDLTYELDAHQWIQITKAVALQLEERGSSPRIAGRFIMTAIALIWWLECHVDASDHFEMNHCFGAQLSIQRDSSKPIVMFIGQDEAKFKQFVNQTQW